MNPEQMWNEYMIQYNIQEKECDSWAFGAAPDELSNLVLKGIKTATASAYPLYEIEKEPLPKAGAYSTILNSKNEAVCIIQTTKVYVVPFREVSAEHAYKEGEGDYSLDYWKQVHTKFFSACMSKIGTIFKEDMLVVCEEFKLVYP